MLISSVQNYNLYKRNFIKYSKTNKKDKSENIDNNRQLLPQYYGYFPNINFCGLTLPKLSLKKSTRNFLKVGNYFSSPLENIPCSQLNKKNYIAYNINQMKYPYGSIGIKTDFSELIQSRDFFQCAGILIIDNKENKQFLAHVYNKTYIEDIYDTFLKAFSIEAFKEKGRLDVFILPGCEKDTKYTISHIFKALDMVDNGISFLVSYVHFNKTNYDCLSVHEGQIFASDDIYKLSLENPDNIFSFNNPIARGESNFRDGISKLYFELEKILSVQKVNRFYTDFKKEIK